MAFTGDRPGWPFKGVLSASPMLGRKKSCSVTGPAGGSPSPTVGACELAARGRLRTAEQARIEAEAYPRGAQRGVSHWPVPPAIRVLVQRTLPFLHLPPEAEELRPTAGASLWRRLAAIAKHKLGKPEWADALNANVNLFLRARSDLDRATAGLLIYLMTVRNSSPFCKPIVNAAWSGRYEMVFEPLIDDWYDADAIVKPYWRCFPEGEARQVVARYACVGAALRLDCAAATQAASSRRISRSR